MGKIMHHILWVDDKLGEEDKSFENAARAKGIDVTWFASWEEAEPVYEKRHDEWAAVVLDCYGQKYKSGAQENVDFLTHVRTRMIRIDAQKRREIKWFIFSAGSRRERFNEILELAPGIEGISKWQDWDKLFFEKNDIDAQDALLRNIIKVGDENFLYRTKSLYSKVFTYLDENEKIDSRASHILANVLMALHYPVGNENFDDHVLLYYNQLRQFVEYIFRALNKYGVIPNECIKKNKVVLRDCCYFLDGKPATGYANVKSKSGKIIPAPIGNLLFIILDITSSHSHTEEFEKEDKEHNRAYPKDVNNKYLLFSFALQLCGMVEWMEVYLRNHPNKDENLSNIIPLQKEQDKKNTDEKAEPKPIPPAETLITGEPLMILVENGVPVIGNYTKLTQEYLKCQFQQAIIREVELNQDEDADKYPYVATKVEFVKK